MIAILVVALSLATSVAVGVPYLPQTDALCGGAAAAIVFRYCGDVHADVQELAPLADRRAGGIANDVLVDAVQKRGWRLGRVNGTLDALQARLRDGQPVIVLVVTGASAEGVVVCFAGRADGVNGLPAGTRRLSASGPFAAPQPRT